jgi:hypothetical protein
LNLYFVLLDVAMPPTIRNRSLYMGAIFASGSRGSTSWEAPRCGCWAVVAAFPHLGPVRDGTTATRVVLFVLAGAHLAVFVITYLLRVGPVIAETSTGPVATAGAVHA